MVDELKTAVPVSENVPAPVEQGAQQVAVPQLRAEEVEAVIAHRLAANHNESLLGTRLHAEEVEAVIAPRLGVNHNETFAE